MTRISPATTCPKFPEDGWAPLEALKAGEFIQGLLAHITPHHTRVYVVTVPTLDEHAAENRL